MANETWKEIPLLNWHHHLVSNMGRVKQKDGKILNGTFEHGYVRIGITISSVQIFELGHRLVAYAF